MYRLKKTCALSNLINSFDNLIIECVFQMQYHKHIGQQYERRDEHVDRTRKKDKRKIF